ncbi:uncharacterized protein BJ171DRAFT_494756 [Polychytrium aggregatum]|uniref:uncharacterized protein n=1 Tax=Polychytrium aggregatum TaxID=110093 RepID=UPI0022FEF8CD|nr:uncharacterized protein BJ171DRAFT_494756 [Polychytrium aggregatum]KAI9207404.1 hypothetical protein BJ171DRAFT_494756 [Polychytrium aggregatum]
MFLDRIAELGLLPRDPKKSVLSRFPLAVRKKLVHEVSQCLLPNQNLVAEPQNLLTSPTHVRWVMEIVGQGFALPIEDFLVIQSTISVYSNWLLEEDSLPVAMKQIEDDQIRQNFWQSIFSHFSLLFEPRTHCELPNNSKIEDFNVSAIQVELCRTILKVLAIFGRQSGHAFSEATWILLLKVLLGMCDRLLSEPLARKDSKRKIVSSGPKSDKLALVVEEEAGPIMGDCLCKHLVRVTIELWLRSKITKIEMWDYLKKFFSRWTHRLDVVTQWNATILALSRRVIGQLYGPPEGAERVIIYVDGYTIDLDLPPKFVVYAWHQMIYMIGNPNMLPFRNFEEAIRGISKVVGEFHAIGIETDSVKLMNATVPDGNTLLHMFGSWLFEATTKQQSEFNKGKAIAFEILCRIVCQPQRRNLFLQLYLDRFYHCLIHGLQSDPFSVTAILLNMPTFYIRELNGALMTIPHMIVAIRRVLPMLQTGFDLPADDLRTAALKIMGTITPFLSHFEAISVPPPIWAQVKFATLAQDEPSKQRIAKIHALYGVNDVTQQLLLLVQQTAADRSQSMEFRLLKCDVLDILISTMMIETFAPNCKYAIHLLTCFALEEGEFCPGLPAFIIKHIHEKACTGVCNSEVVLYSFDALLQLGNLYKHVIRDNPGCPRELVLALCRLIEILLMEDNTVAYQVVISRAYDCMIRWVLLGEWFLNDKTVTKVVIGTLCRGIGLLDRDDEFSTVIQTATAAAAPSTTAAVTLGAPAASTAATATASAAASTSPSTPILASANAVIASIPIYEKVPAIVASIERSLDKKKNNRTGTKLFQKKTAPSSTGVSTGTTDGGLGLPTFATLSAEMMIKGAAEAALVQLANHLNNFPPVNETTGVSRISTLWNEEAEVKRMLSERDKLLGPRPRIQPVSGEAEGPTQDLVLRNGIALSEYRRFLRYYAYDHRVILCVVERPPWAYQQPGDHGDMQLEPFHRKEQDSSAEPDGQATDEANRWKQDKCLPELTILIRDSSGKYSWKSRLEYLDEKALALLAPEKPEKPEDVLASSELFDELEHDSYHFIPTELPYSPNNCTIERAVAVNEASIPDIETLFDESAEIKEAYNAYHQKTQEFTEKERGWRTEILQSDDYAGIEVKVDPTPPIDLMDPNHISQVSRLYLGHSGLASPEHRSKLKPLQISDSFLRDLERLDTLPERDCLSFGVLFCRSGKDTIQDILSPKGISTDFKQFMSSLAWPVDLETHPGYKGRLSKTYCSTAPYWANRNWEIIFNCPYYIHDTSVGVETPNIAIPTSVNSASGLSFPSPSGDLPYETPESLFQSPSMGDSAAPGGAGGLGISRSRSNSHSHSRSSSIGGGGLYVQTAATGSSGSGWGSTSPSMSNFRGAARLSPIENDSLLGTPVALAPDHPLGMREIFGHVAQDDIVYIVWIEDNHKLDHVIKRFSKTENESKLASSNLEGRDSRVRRSPQDEELQRKRQSLPGSKTMYEAVGDFEKRITHDTSGDTAEVQSTVSKEAPKPRDPAFSSSSGSTGGPAKRPGDAAAGPTAVSGEPEHLWNGQIFIVIHPLAKTPGLYEIRIVTVETWKENLYFGPLLDGMIVSQHALGTLVRSTAISAHLSFKLRKGGYRKPHLVRRNAIEELCTKHRMSGSLADFYGDLYY